MLHVVIQELDFFHIVRQAPFNYALLRLSHNGMRRGLVQDWQKAKYFGFASHRVLLQLLKSAIVTEKQL